MAFVKTTNEGRFSRLMVLAACLLMVAACSGIDYLGGDLRIGPWYVLPIALATWRLGRTPGLVIAVLSVLARVPVTVLPFHEDQLATLFTNSALTLAAFLLTALLVAWFRSTHLNLQETVAARVAELQAKVAENELTAASLRENERQLRVVLDTMLGGLHIIDLETGQSVVANRAVCEMLGYTHEEILTRSVFDIIAPSEHEKLKQGLKRLEQGASYVVDDARCVRKDGSIFPADLSVTTLMYHGRLCSLAFIRDTTEHHRATEAIRHSEANYRAIFNADNDALFVHDYETGELVDFNQKAADIYGFKLGDLEGMRVHLRGSTESPYSAEERLKWVRKAAEEGPQTFEWLARVRDGRRIWTEMSLKRATIAGHDRILAAAHDITKRRMTEQALRESETKHRALIEVTGTGYVILDSEGRVIDANAEYVRLTGRESLAQIIGHSVIEWTAEHDLERNAEEVRRCVQVGGVRSLEVDYVDPQGRITPIEIDANVLTTPDGIRILTLCRDITIRKQAEAAQRETERALHEIQERHRLLFESVADPIFTFDRDLRFVAANPAAAREMHSRPEDLVGRRMMDVFPPQVGERQAASVRRVFETGKPLFSEENESQTPAGPRWYNTSLTPMRGPDGRVEFVIGIARDVTERRLAATALLNSERQLQAVFDTMPDGLLLIDMENERLVATNPAMSRLLGMTEAEVLERSIVDLVPEPHAADRVAAVRERLLRGEAFQLTDYMVRRKDGSTFHAESSNVTVVYHGRPSCLSIVRDITERKTAEEAVRRSEENYRTLFEGNLDGIIVMVDGRIVSANDAFARIMGSTLSDVMGTMAIEWIHPDDQSVGLTRHDLLMAGNSLDRAQPYRAIRKDGSHVWVEAQGRRTDWGGQPALQVIFRDLTAQRRVEEELRQAQKLEALGRMASGIAHDFNNLITGILCHAGLLKSGAKGNRETLETATIIEKAARRAADLTSGLLGFARRGKHQDVPVDVCATVDNVVNLVRGTMDPRISIHKMLPDKPVWVRGDPTQTEQAILNLALNARDAMPDGGRLTLTVRTADLDAAACADRPGARPGTFVIVAVADTGVGMTPEIQGHIFEPFFTTKPPGKGIGMGLPMVYGIVANHGGWIEVETQPGHGSKFALYLPASLGPDGRERKAATAADLPAEGRLERDSARILLVDDEELVRSVAERMLVKMGYKVVAVSNGAEALEYYRSYGSRCDLVIIDMIMPKMDGRECLRALRELNPQLRAILCAGGGADDAMREALRDGLVTFVPKPYTMDRLAEVISQVLGQKQ
jgi:two-component system, cell cycle sensor histidine kinase and response regulator CckA